MDGDDDVVELTAPAVAPSMALARVEAVKAEMFQLFRDCSPVKKKRAVLRVEKTVKVVYELVSDSSDEE